MEICKICGKEYSNLGVHVRQAHKMGIDKYREKYPKEEVPKEEVPKEEVPKEEVPKEEVPKEEVQEEEENDFPEEEDTIEPTKVVISEKIEEDDKEVTDFSKELLEDFLNTNDMTKKELIAVIDNYKTGANIPVKMTEKRDQAIGEAGAIALKDQNYAETRQLHVAETLVKNYGFKVKEVTTRGHTQPKTWCLVKV